MSYSNSFPTQRPSLNLDFANSGKLDSRISFSRADTPPTYAAPSAVHYWSNEKHLSTENLLPYSNDLSQSAWSKLRTTVLTTNNLAPDGSNSASSLVEQSTTGEHSHYYAYSVTAGTTYSHTLFAKANGRSVIKMGYYFISPSQVSEVEFDLVALTATVLNGTVTNESITDVGNGWRKLTFSTVADSNGTAYFQNYFSNGSSYSYAGDTSKGAFLWGHQASSTGQTVVNQTSGQIHREFASTLKSVANAGDPRFEYSPADGQSAAGSPRGLLIESQSSNLIANSNDFSTGSIIDNLNIEAAAGIAPNGTLSASLLRATGSTSHRIRKTVNVTSGKTYSASVYVKASGYNYLFLSSGNTSIWAARAYFDLSNGTVGTVGFGTASIEDVGNGYFRCSITGSAASSSSFYLQFNVADADGSTSFTSNDYGGLLAFGLQFEEGSTSSLISTSGASATRSADSCSVVSAPLLDNGSGGLTVEYDMRNASSTSYVLQTARSTGATNNDGVTIFNEGLFVNGAGSNTRIGATTSNVFHKVAASWESGSQKISRDGSAVAEDTTTVVPQSGTDKLHIGARQDGAVSINGHIRNIAIFAEPLSSTNLTTLSQL